MRTDEAYIRSLERRIRNQRRELAWWNAQFTRRELHNKDSCWSASGVCELLRRLGSPHVVTDDGRVARKVKAKRGENGND